MEVGGDGLRLGIWFGGSGGSWKGLRARDPLRIPWTSKNQIFSILLKFYMEVGDEGSRLGRGFGGSRRLMEGSGALAWRVEAGSYKGTGHNPPVGLTPL